MIKVFIVDDHPAMRAGFKFIIREAQDMALAGEAAHYMELMEKLSEVTPDVLLLDFGLPGRDGIETLKDVKKKYPKIKVLMISMHPPDRFALRALQAGGDGYISKDEDEEELLSAVINK